METEPADGLMAASPAAITGAPAAAVAAASEAEPPAVVEAAVGSLENRVEKEISASSFRSLLSRSSPVKAAVSVMGQIDRSDLSVRLPEAPAAAVLSEVMDLP